MKQPSMPHNFQKIILEVIGTLWALNFFIGPKEFKGIVYVALYSIVFLFVVYKAILCYRQHLKKTLYFYIIGGVMILLLTYLTYVMYYI